MTVQLGITQWSLRDRGFAALDVAAQFGLRCIQIDVGGSGRPEPFAMLAAVRRGYRMAAETSGVEIVGMTTGLLDEYGMTAALGTLRREYCWNTVRAAVETAAEMNVRVVYLPAFNDGEIITDEHFKLTAEMLRAAHEHLQPSSTELAVETSLGAQGIGRLLEYAGIPGLTVLFDTYNAVKWGHDPNELFDAIGTARCAQLHVKDGYLGGMGNVPIGTGNGRTEQVVRHVVEQGFDGCLLLEGDYKSSQDRLAVDVSRLTAWTRDRF